MTLHVGCPAAASSDTFSFVDYSPKTTTLSYNESTTAIITLTYQSFTQSLPYTCLIQSTYYDIDITTYVDYSTSGPNSAPLLS